MKEQNKYCNIILRQFIIELLEMYLSCPFYQDLFTPMYLKTENGANSNLYHKKSQTFITQLLTPTHAQLQRDRLKFIKNHIQTPTCSGLRPSSGIYNVLDKVPASAVDTALARTRKLGRFSSTTRYKQHDMLPHHHA